jgi:gamma-glutamylcyclotransferase (GGCT)/AIG2-like uncharacterized protein YtfP
MSGRARAAGARCRLAAYGTLAPGRENHHVLAGLRGAWRPCAIPGRLHPAGWGCTGGFPGLVWDPEACAIPAQLLESPDLPAHWDRLDAFEGSAYHRRVVPVLTDDGPVLANVYTVADA